MALTIPVQDPDPKQRLDNQQPDLRAGVLVPPALADELKLDAEQRKKVDELEQQFQQQRKAALMMSLLKVKTIMDKIERNEEPAPALAITTAVTTSLLDLKRAQAAFEKKVMTVLTDEQQRQYAAWKKLRPKDKRDPRPGRTPGSRGALHQELLPEHGQVAGRRHQHVATAAERFMNLHGPLAEPGVLVH
jgi:hypothetical protein